jgi:hypothetical protein
MGRLEVVGAIEPCGTVECSTGPLYQLEMLVRGDVRRTLEEHVLEQVLETGRPARSFAEPTWYHRFTRRAGAV